jgi:alpha-amylase
MCFYACNSTDDLQGPTAETKALSKVIDVTHHGHPFSTGKSTTTTGKYVANPGVE